MWAVGKEAAEVAELKRQIAAFMRLVSRTRRDYYALGLIAIETLTVIASAGYFAIVVSQHNTAVFIIAIGGSLVGLALAGAVNGYRSHFADQLMALLNSSPQAFEVSMPLLFQTKGYQVVACERIADGQLLRLRQDRALHVAYCMPTLLAVSSADVDVCDQAMDKYGAVFGYVVTRSWFLPGAVGKARELGIDLVDGAKLREWLILARTE